MRSTSYLAYVCSPSSFTYVAKAMKTAPVRFFINLRKSETSVGIVLESLHGESLIDCVQVPGPHTSIGHDLGVALYSTRLWGPHIASITQQWGRQIHLSRQGDSFWCPSPHRRTVSFVHRKSVPKTCGRTQTLQSMSDLMLGDHVYQALTFPACLLWNLSPHNCQTRLGHTVCLYYYQAGQE